MNSKANKLIYPTLLISAAAVMAAYLQIPIPSLVAAALVFVLLLIQLAASRRVQTSAVVPPEFQAKLASLENQNNRQLKELTQAQADLLLAKEQVSATETRIQILMTREASFEAQATRLQNAVDQSKGGDEQAVIQFVRNLQARGRFLDFVMADIHKLPDAQVGAVARVVHQGLRALTEDYFAIKPIATENEGDVISVPESAVGKSYSLVQSSSDTIPSRGRLLHRGWQAGRMKLPQSQKQESPAERLVFAPAEIDVSEIQG